MAHCDAAVCNELSATKQETACEFKLGPLDNMQASFITSAFAVGASADVEADAMADSMAQTIGGRVRAMHGLVPELFGSLCVSTDGRVVIRNIPRAAVETTRWLERGVTVADATALANEHMLNPVLDPASGELSAPIFHCIVSPQADDQEVLVLVTMHHIFGDIQTFGRLCRALIEGNLTAMVAGPRVSAPAPPGPLAPPPAGMSYAPEPAAARITPPPPAPPSPQVGGHPNAKGSPSLFLMTAAALGWLPPLAPVNLTVCRRVVVGGFPPEMVGARGKGGGETGQKVVEKLTTHDAVTARLWRATVRLATLEATQGQILSQSPTDATSSR